MIGSPSVEPRHPMQPITFWWPGSGNSKCFQPPSPQGSTRTVSRSPCGSKQPQTKIASGRRHSQHWLKVYAATPQKVLARTSKRPRSLNGNGRWNTGVQIILHNAVLDSTFSSQFRNTWSCKEYWRSPVPKKGGLTTTKLVHRPTNPLRHRAQRQWTADRWNFAGCLGSLEFLELVAFASMDGHSD